MENVINNINYFFVYRFINVHKLDQHLEQEHKIELQTSVLQFDNFDAFLQWKEVEELHTKSSFVQKSGSQMHDNKSISIITAIEQEITKLMEIMREV